MWMDVGGVEGREFGSVSGHKVGLYFIPSSRSRPRSRPGMHFENGASEIWSTLTECQKHKGSALATGLGHDCLKPESSNVHSIAAQLSSAR